MRLKYDRVQLRKAAKYIAKHNPNAQHAFNCVGANEYTLIDEISNSILTRTIRYAVDIMNGSAPGYISTAGYWVYIGYENEHTMYADILVDPSVGKGPDTTDIEL